MAASRIQATLLAIILVLVLVPRPACAAGSEYEALAWGDTGLARVSLRVRLASTSWGRRSAFGMLSLTVPLERFVEPAPALPPTNVLAEPPDPGPTDTDPAPGADEAPPAPGSEPQPATLAVLLSPELARETVKVALQAAGFADEGKRLSSLSARARSSAALPELRLRGGRSTDESLRLTPTDSDPYRYTQAGGAELFFEVRLTWKLDRLLFATSELRLEQLRRTRAEAKARLVSRVLGVLFAWQRARAKLAFATLLPEERAMVMLEEIEAQALLDVYTAGWFSRRRAPDAASQP
jgi:hypothetical protein